jgi:hypothetical protein
LIIARRRNRRARRCSRRRVPHSYRRAVVYSYRRRCVRSSRARRRRLSGPPECSGPAYRQVYCLMRRKCGSVRTSPRIGALERSGRDACRDSLRWL